MKVKSHRGVYLNDQADKLAGAARSASDEVMDTRWVDYHDLMAEVARHPERFTPWLKIYLRDHADTIFGPDLIISAQTTNKTA